MKSPLKTLPTLLSILWCYGSQAQASEKKSSTLLHIPTIPENTISYAQHLTEFFLPVSRTLYYSTQLHANL